MNSYEYWKIREHQHTLEQMSRENDVASMLEKNLDKAKIEIEHKIQVFYERYARKEHISLEDAMKRVSSMDIRVFEEKARKYVENRDFSERANEELRLYNATMRINRLELLKAEVNLALVKANAKNEKLIQNHLTNLASEEYARQAGILGDIIINSKAAVNTIVNASFHTANFSERLWFNHNALVSDLGVTLRRSITQGVNPVTETTRIRDKFKVTKHEAKRLLVTESARVQGDVQLDSFEQAGYDEYIYLAEPSACAVCNKLDGNHFKITDREVGKNYYPMHPFCKCSSAPYSDDDRFEKLVNDYLQGSQEEDSVELDSMANSKLYVLNNGESNVRIRATKLQGLKYDVWVEDSSKKSRNTLELLKQELQHFNNIPKIIIAREDKFKNIAGYDNKNDILYISNKLNSISNINKLLASGYFAARNLKDILTHELAHKKHWDNAKSLYKKYPKRYNNIESAKRDLDSELMAYVKTQVSLDRQYLSNISKNAKVAYSNGNINELVAEVEVLDDIVEDKELLNKVKGVLEWNQ
ncbi:minor capsid protein [Gemella sp. GH3]|uniref:minor capsid protein n=1 Tax=unclassified Gemella TaxID=2624949 RepID=UPI0015D01846|nr:MULTISPECIES: minor capsid protein [unclassified Gemella]MBF0714502.1 minor capsid protein [Gemella sp. GH3.1]NYS51454.1 minor capsid protein [Gemella sp. GH3]